MCRKCYIESHPVSPSSFKKGEISGDKHPNWKGGEWQYLRRQALIRDNYTCQICDLYDPDIVDVDHIIPKSIAKHLMKNPDCLENLQTLCPNCHKRKSNREAKLTKTH